MAIYDFELKLVSPAFVAGTNKNRPEMRAASIRGQLRYWLRAMLGASDFNVDSVWEAESAIFGSTAAGSTVSVRVYSNGQPQSQRVAMLPHREGTPKNVSNAEALRPNQTFQLQLVTRPGVKLSEGARKALLLWSLLGGVGRRSRRMMGAVEILPAGADVAWYEPLNSPAALQTAIVDALSSIVPTTLHPVVPPFPVLHPERSWIIIGAPSNTYKVANQEFFRDLLRNAPFRSQEDAFGYARGQRRRASPIHAQVRRIAGQYYPVITAFYANPLDNPQYKNTLRDFMNAALDHYSGSIHVYGGW